MNGSRLPITWPVVVLFVAFPVWWLLGVSAFIWPVVAAPMLLALVWRRRTRAPVALIAWLAFISWVLLSGLQIKTGTTILTFGYRFSLYAAAAVLFLYVYNMPRSDRLDGKVLRSLTIFWMIVVAGGYAGLLLRGATFVPPFEHLIPHGLRNKPFVQELVQPVFAQVQGFLGFPVPRPAAPFAYTNNWGGNIAALTLVAFGSIAVAGRGAWRRLLIAMLAASLVPMIFSLNRGMFLSITIGVLYVTVRLAIRGRIGALAVVLAVTALMVTVVAVTPLGHLFLSGFVSSHGNSNRTRLALYQQASAGAGASPLFGYGAPKAAIGQTTGPAIGTQGQLWLVLYSHGFPALAFFVGFILAVLWQTRRAAGVAGLCLHAVPLVALSQIAFYGWLPVELQVVMVAAALAYRRCGPARQVPPGALAVVQERRPSPRLVGVGGPSSPSSLAGPSRTAGLSSPAGPAGPGGPGGAS